MAIQAYSVLAETLTIGVARGSKKRIRRESHYLVT